MYTILGVIAKPLGMLLDLLYGFIGNYGICIIIFTVVVKVCLYPLYIKQIAIKYGESALPQYSITLTEEIEVVLNQIGKAAADLKDVNVLIEELMKNNRSLEANLSIVENNKTLGRFFYYGGTWSGNGEEYVVSDSQAPYFDYVETIHY